jgi:transketolase
MGAASTAYCLWQYFLRYDPDDPEWPNRDRFVLSAGHASALLYSLLYLTEVRATGPHYQEADRQAITLDDLKSFRQAGSRCTGHPEYGWTSGVETTTGPLGQGAAVSVGMAIAGCWLAATYNRPGFDLFNHNVYSLCSDGDVMEGISSEAASLAGHLQLSNLCWVYDDNRIMIEGSTNLTFTEDVGARFTSKYAPASGVARGAYVLADAPHGKPDVLLLGTGSEVSLCVTAYEKLQSEGINAQVISMPSWELFEHQSQEYRDSVPPPDILARVAVEEASIFGWERYAGNSGTILGMRCFGLSAPGAIVADHFGFTPERVVAAAKEQIAKHAAR